MIAAANVCDELVYINQTGTMTCTVGSATVTGSGTNWSEALVGCAVWVNAVAYRVIASVESATSLTLDGAWYGANQSGVPTSIVQTRYTVNGVLSTAQGRGENLAAIEQAMAGFCVWSQGAWHIHAGAYSAPTVTLTDADLADSGEIITTARVARAQLFNAVKGTYADPLNNWQPTDYPPVTNSTYESEDGGERLETDLTLALVTDAWRAQRIAKIELERHRQSLLHVASYKLSAYRITPGDIIGRTSSRYGWSGKPFRVIDRQFSATTGVRLTLKEEASGVYDWNLGEATRVDLAPNSSLPSPFQSVAMPALTLAAGTDVALLNADGSYTRRLTMSWSAIVERAVTEGGDHAAR